MMPIVITLSLTKTFPCQFLLCLKQRRFHQVSFPPVQTSRNTNNTRRFTTSARDQVSNDRRSSVIGDHPLSEIVRRDSFIPSFVVRRLHKKEHGEKRGDINISVTGEVGYSCESPKYWSTSSVPLDRKTLVCDRRSTVLM